MKRAFALAVAGAIVAAACWAAQAQTTSKPASTTWQYAHLFTGTTTFLSPDGDVVGDNLDDLYVKLGGKPLTKDHDHVTWHDISNLIGARGWELVTLQDAQNVGAVYYFKRPG